MRTTRLATFTVAISTLLLTLSPPTLNRVARAQTSSDPSSRMYCTGFGVSTHLYRVDNYSNNPRAIDIGETGLRLTDIAITPNGTAYVITETNLYKINLENGKTTPVGMKRFTYSQNSLEAASDTKLFMWSPGNTWIRSMDLTNLTVTDVVDTGKYGADLALAPGGIELYGASLDGMLIKYNLVTKALTTIGSFGITTDYMSGLDFASDGQLYGTHGGNTTGLAQVYKIDVCSGKATPVGLGDKPTGNIAGASQLGNGGMAMKW